MPDRLDALLAQLRERFDPDARQDEVEAYLSSQGYDRRQIGEILTLLFRSVRAPGEPAAGSATIRVLGTHERGRFAPEAWGHLLALSGSGALSAVELEHVIERALTQLDGRIALDDLRSLMEMAGYDDAGASGEQPTVH